MKGKIYKLLPQAKILNLHLLPSQKGLFRGQIGSINVMGLWPIFFQVGPLKISDGWGPKILQGWVRKISKQGGPTYPDPPPAHRYAGVLKMQGVLSRHRC